MNKNYLHIHSTYSVGDSPQSPEDIVLQVKKLGGENVTLTDHRTLLGVDAFMDAGRKHGINTIPGVENEVNLPEKYAIILSNGDDVRKEALSHVRNHIVMIPYDYAGFRSISYATRDANTKIVRINKTDYPCLTDTMLENHFSGTLITFCIGAIVIFSGGAMLRWFVGAAAVLCSAVFAVLFGTDYASERIDIWLHPENFSVTDETWQITQGLIAVGSGGIFGRGLGNGLQKHLYVSAPHNDFIFSIVCEELGLIGAAAVIGLFFMFVKRALQLAMRCETLFMSLVAVGIAGHVGLQAFLNIAVVTATIPNTGVTLPFFSYGGSALVVLLCESGILLSVTKNKTKSERERQV